MPIAPGKQKPPLCFDVSPPLLLLLAAYLFNFLRGRRGLPYLWMFIPANRPLAFCLQVTRPQVTFNSRCGHASGGGTASRPEEITNTVEATELHSFMVRAGERERQLYAIARHANGRRVQGASSCALFCGSFSLLFWSKIGQRTETRRGVTEHTSSESIIVSFY